MLEVRDLQFGYGDIRVLDSVTLSAKKGEILALLGPNGCGKTTLLKLLSGVLTPNDGSVLLEERTLDSWAPKELARTLAAVEQHIPVPFDFTVREIVHLGRLPHLSRFQRERSEDHALVEQVLKKTDTLHMAHKPLTHLSSGERQRVWLAMALAQEPKVLLLDEPTSHLDIHYQLSLMQMLQELAAEGLTVVMSIHDLNLAGQYADQLALMHKGRLHSVGSPETVLTASHIREVFQAHVEILLEPSGKFRGTFPVREPISG